LKKTKQYDVVGVGRAVYDYTVLVERYPENNTKTEAIDRFEGGGSPVPNALCQLSVWGWNTSLGAIVGNDYHGTRFIEDTSRYGVHIDKVKMLENQRTPCAFLWVEKNSGKRTIVLDRDIAPLSPNDLPYSELKSCRSLLIDGWEADAALEAASLVRKAGGKIMLDAGNVRQRMDELLSSVNWIVVPQAFHQAFYGDIDFHKALLDLRKRGTELAIITNGSKGCTAAWEDKIEHFPAYDADIVDSTGAGDIFHAGILHGLLKKWAIPDCIRWASAAATLATGKLGGRGRLPGEKDTALILEQRLRETQQR